MPVGVIVACLLAVPLIELAVIIQVGQAIGTWPTIALLIAESLLGAVIVKREGRRAWREFQQTLASGQLPGESLADGVLIIVGGTLLLTPGFVTDIAGFFFIIPVTRPLARRAMLALAHRRAAKMARRGYAPRGRGGVYRVYRDEP